MKKLRVLIVDDSSVMRKIVERALGLAGLELAEILEASNRKQNSLAPSLIRESHDARSAYAHFSLLSRVDLQTREHH